MVERLNLKKYSGLSGFEEYLLAQRILKRTYQQSISAILILFLRLISGRSLCSQAQHQDRTSFLKWLNWNLTNSDLSQSSFFLFYSIIFTYYFFFTTPIFINSHFFFRFLFIEYIFYHSGIPSGLLFYFSFFFRSPLVRQRFYFHSFLR